MQPRRSTSCVGVQRGIEPPSCPTSPDEGASCLLCGGSLVVRKGPGNSIVDLDQVYFAPGAWARYKPESESSKDAVEAVLAMGTKLLRFGGTFSWQPEYLWKTFRGQREERQPYLAYHDPKYGASRGYGKTHTPWYAYSHKTH